MIPAVMGGALMNYDTSSDGGLSDGSTNSLSLPPPVLSTRQNGNKINTNLTN